MPCFQLPPFPPLPVLPTGVTIPVFTPPVLPPSVNVLCCNINIPPFPIPAIALTIAFPAAVITALNGYLQAAQAYYDALGTFNIVCPFS